MGFLSLVIKQKTLDILILAIGFLPWFSNELLSIFFFFLMFLVKLWNCFLKSSPGIEYFFLIETVERANL